MFAQVISADHQPDWRHLGFLNVDLVARRKSRVFVFEPDNLKSADKVKHVFIFWVIEDNPCAFIVIVIIIPPWVFYFVFYLLFICFRARYV